MEIAVELSPSPCNIVEGNLGEVSDSGLLATSWSDLISGIEDRWTLLLDLACRIRFSSSGPMKNRSYFFIDLRSACSR